MVSESEFRCGDPGTFVRRGFTNILFNVFEGSNEEITGTEQKEEVLW